VRAILKISARGGIVLPATLRKAMALKGGDQLIATSEGLLRRPTVTPATEIYTTNRIGEIDKAEAELASALTPKKRARRPSAAPKVGTRRR
jgi:bifunctional DNA-binding transcriptional regulator/antitoxin component of YhaV-PrlF toxin-antitoxin module